MKRIYVALLVGGLLFVTLKESLLYPALRQRNSLTSTNQTKSMFETTARGEQKRFTLPDGSTVWLNAASTLLYPNDMATGDRSVELFGEAIFDVVPKSSRPFRLKASDMDVQVLGTSFNVRNYPDEQFTRTVVTSGSIRVRYMDEVVTLHAGDLVQVDPQELNGRGLSIKSGTDTISVTAWTRGQLTFTKIDLRSLLKNLSRAYNVDIQLIGRDTDRRYSGSIFLRDSIDQAIQSLVMPFENVSISHPDRKRMVITIKS